VPGRLRVRCGALPFSAMCGEGGRDSGYSCASLSKKAAARVPCWLEWIAGSIVVRHKTPWLRDMRWMEDGAVGL